MKTAAPNCRLLIIRQQRVPESADGRRTEAAVTWPVHRTIHFTFEGGPRNCESVAVDTSGNEILLISKSQPLDCGLFRIPLDLNSGTSRTTAQRLATIGIPFATAMDISEDSRRMVVVSPFGGVLLERDHLAVSWKEACGRPSIVLELPMRRQGESVCFESKGRSILTHSEFVGQPLWRTRLPERKTRSLSP